MEQTVRTARIFWGYSLHWEAQLVTRQPAVVVPRPRIVPQPRMVITDSRQQDLAAAADLRAIGVEMVVVVFMEAAVVALQVIRQFKLEVQAARELSLCSSIRVWLNYRYH